ncbi:MAG: 50S ribosomal protein L24 [Nitrospira sp.]|nr:50S ribosomal protein L24 [Candidatus Manganitrophaceae bacterium]HIL35517.1 50S ribosomal protein L24 [Candidatus Manganitrophaceae bacterium]
MKVAAVVRTKIRKGDLVRVTSGKEKGKEGKVLGVLYDKESVVVERLNLLKKHVRPNQQNSQGGIIEKEGRIHLSNVMLLCGNCNKPARVGMKRLEDGKKMRTCRRCGEVLDKEV